MDYHMTDEEIDRSVAREQLVNEIALIICSNLILHFPSTVENDDCYDAAIAVIERLSDK